MNRKGDLVPKADPAKNQPREPSQVCGRLSAVQPTIPIIETRKPTVWPAVSSARFERTRLALLLRLRLLLLLSPRTRGVCLPYLLLLARQSHDVGDGTLVEEASRLKLGNGTPQVRRRAPHVPFSTHPQKALSLSVAASSAAAACMHRARLKTPLGRPYTLLR